jgi:hypothetical protein
MAEVVWVACIGVSGLVVSVCLAKEIVIALVLLLFLLALLWIYLGVFCRYVLVVSGREVERICV